MNPSRESPNRDIKTGYDNTGGQTGLSAEELSSREIPVPLHPDSTSASLEAQSREPARPDPVCAVESFVARISASLESDYGDWMREANLAWLDLADVLSRRSARIDEKLERLHDIIQYRPSWIPKETCRAAFILARDIRRELGISGDLDLHRFGIGWTEPETAIVELEEASPYPNHHLPKELRHASP